MSWMRSPLIAVATATALLAGPAATASAWDTRTLRTWSVTSCLAGWGSLPKTSDVDTASLVTDVRAGHHTCFDRVVIDLSGDPDGYDVRYVPALATEGEGRIVDVRGAARLQIIVRSHAYTADGFVPTYLPADPNEMFSTSGMGAVQQAVWLGSFEGQSVIGLGVRGTLPFRAFTLDDPGPGARLVVDVAHSW
ncbi:MAG: hypothetical protein ACK5MT_17190 [Actinomycetales bacterium]